LDAAAKKRVRLQYKVSQCWTKHAFFFASESFQAIQATGYKNAELALVDLSQFSSVSAFADTFIRDGSQIDIFVYNAGVAWLNYSATGDGWEET